jgi:hypothetical protein
MVSAGHAGSMLNMMHVLASRDALVMFVTKPLTCLAFADLTFLYNFHSMSLREEEAGIDMQEAFDVLDSKDRLISIDKLSTVLGSLGLRIVCVGRPAASSTATMTSWSV